MLSFFEFENSLKLSEPPQEYSEELKSLWKVANNDWQNAHSICVSHEGFQSFDQIHAYLHRLEGDDFNAKWWYRNIKKPFPSISPEEEWKELVISNLK